jgi:uncharacterized protein YukE
MANISQTYSGDLTTSIASKIFDIISDARVEKSKAQEEADKYGVDVNFTPGEFTARSARNDLIKNTLGSRFVPKTKYPDLLARGQATSDPLMGTPVHLRKLPEYQQLASEEEKKFRSRSKAVPSRKPSTSPSGSSSTKPESTTSDPIKVQDKKLGVFLAAVAKSLAANVASINSRIDETESGVIEAKEGIFGTIKQLEQNSEILETKLDAIIDALREQNTNAQKSEDNAQSQQREGELEKESDLSSVERIIKPDEKQSDIIQLNLLDDIRENTQEQQQSIPDPWGDEGFERGGIVSGPDSGYLAKLHGDEMIVPLDNNYTQGQPSAIDGKIAQKPGMLGNLPKFERGTQTPSFTELPKNDKISFSNIPNNNDNNKESAEMIKSSEDLMKAMDFTIQSTGIMNMMAMTSAINNMGGLAGEAADQLKQIINPIASHFGVSNRIATSVIRQKSAEQKAEERKEKTKSFSSDVESRGRAWWDPLGLFTGRDGTGGSNSVNSTTYNRTGGYRVGGDTYNRKSGTGGPLGFLPGTGRVMTPSAGDNGSYMQDGRTVQKFLGMEVPFSAKRSGYTPEDVQRYNSQDSGTQMQTYDAVPHPSRKELAEKMRREYNINISDPAYRTRSVQPQVTPRSSRQSTGNRRLDGAIRNAQDIGDMTGTRGLMDQTATIAEKTQRRNDILRQYMRDAGMSGADESMNMYGKPMGDQSNLTSPDYKRQTIAQLDLSSKDQALSRLNKSSTQPDPIIINNQTAEDFSADIPRSHIANMGDSGLSELYPSPA